MSTAMEALGNAGMLPEDERDDDDGRDYSQIDMLIMGRPDAVKFDQVGDQVEGLVVDQFAQQAKDFDSGALKFWDDGRPVLDPVVILNTHEGLRTLYVGSYRMRNAIRDAILAAGFEYGGTRGVPGLRKGGRLIVRYSGDGESKKRGGPKPKEYSAGYDPPGRRPIPPLPEIPAPADAAPDAAPPF